ncbi:MAG: methionine--tRNA ligase [bacterium]|nr:methionine--tRNA ligase [bacterium]
MAKYYLTTTLPYVNAAPHLGHALEFVQADVLARSRRAAGDEVVFNTGTDEHGLKIYRKALEEGKDPAAYVAEYAAKFDDLKHALNLSYTNFIRTHTPEHMAAAQEFWRRCAATGDIYKKQYAVKYCVGCELEKTDSELVDGACPIHPSLTLETIEEKNYFFRFSKYQVPLLALYRARPDFVVPEARLREITSFVERGLTDFSISRLKAKMPWGVPVPDDADHVVYVWFDALVNYISTLGWPHSASAEGEAPRGTPETFSEWWGSVERPNAVQVAGKDNLRQQSAMWQAMLMSADLPPSKQIFIHGFIGIDGQKMAKSAGNIIDPFVIAEKYGTDALRYYLLRELPAYEDGDFSIAKFEEAYNGSLANGLGNLVSRVVKMAATANCALPKPRAEAGVRADTVETLDAVPEFDTLWKAYDEGLAEFNFKAAADAVWAAIAMTDRHIQSTEPFKKMKTDPEAAKRDILALLADIRAIALHLAPMLPGTSEKILAAVMAPSSDFKPLFPRLH